MMNVGRLTPSIPLIFILRKSSRTKEYSDIPDISHRSRNPARIGKTEVCPTIRSSSVSNMACHAGPSGLSCTQRKNSFMGILARVRRLYPSRISEYSLCSRGPRTMRIFNIREPFLPKRAAKTPNARSQNEHEGPTTVNCGAQSRPYVENINPWSLVHKKTGIRALAGRYSDGRAGPFTVGRTFIPKSPVFNGASLYSPALVQDGWGPFGLG